MSKGKSFRMCWLCRFDNYTSSVMVVTGESWTAGTNRLAVVED